VNRTYGVRTLNSWGKNSLNHWLDSWVLSISFWLLRYAQVAR